MKRPKSLEEHLEFLLNDLCIQGGFCLPADKSQSIVTRRRWEAHDFAREVLRLEGFSTPEYEIKLQRSLARRFTDYFGRAVVRAEEFEQN